MPKSPERANKMLKVVHSNVYGPMQISTFGVSEYFGTFIDRFSHFCVVFLRKQKSEVAAKFAEFVAFAETQAGIRVNLLSSADGGEYKSRDMTKVCSGREIIQMLSLPMHLNLTEWQIE